MPNPLVNALTPKARAILYVAAFLASLGWGAWQASDGDWQKAVPAFLGSLLLATAASNASPTPTSGKDAAGEDGNLDVGLGLLILIFVGVVPLLFRVHF